MNLEEQWKDINAEDEDLSSVISKGVKSISSKDPLQKIKRNLLVNAVFGILISAGYVFILIKFPVWQVLVCIGIVLLFTLWATWRGLLLFTAMNKTAGSNTLVQEMERHYNGITQWINLQKQAGWLIYPVSAAGGFMIGGAIGAGKTIDEVMNKPMMVVALLITIAVLVPLCFYLAKWMSKKAFGDYAAQLKQNIDLLKKEN